MLVRPSWHSCDGRSHPDWPRATPFRIEYEECSWPSWTSVLIVSHVFHCKSCQIGKLCSFKAWKTVGKKKKCCATVCNWWGEEKEEEQGEGDEEVTRKSPMKKTSQIPSKLKLEWFQSRVVFRRALSERYGVSLTRGELKQNLQGRPRIQQEYCKLLAIVVYCDLYYILILWSLTWQPSCKLFLVFGCFYILYYIVRGLLACWQCVFFLWGLCGTPGVGPVRGSPCPCASVCG